MLFTKKFIGNSDSFFFSADNKYVIVLPAEIKLSPPYNSPVPTHYNTGNLPFFRVFNGSIWNYTEFRSAEGDTAFCCHNINQWQNDNDVDTFIPYAQGYADLDYRNVSSFVIDYLDAPHVGQIFLLDDFYTDLYPELLVNDEQATMAQNYLINDDPTKELDSDFWSDKNLKFYDFVERYNKNVLLLRSTRKVQASVTGSISSSSSGGSVNLSGVENKLQNINNNLTDLNSKLEIEKIVDDETEKKSITEIIDEKSSDNPIVVSSEDLSPWSPV